MSENGSDSRLSARDLAREAKATIEDLTGRSPETVSALQWDGDTWLITVETCELSNDDVVAPEHAASTKVQVGCAS